MKLIKDIEVNKSAILLNVLLGNDTDYVYCENGSYAEIYNSTDMNDTNHEFDAFLYIICVLSFYALSMVLLMIKYIRREEAEMSLDYYYTEFVKRDRFQCAQFQNKTALQREKTRFDKYWDNSNGTVDDYVTESSFEDTEF
ncbi:hypothetical protein SNE40_004980 [Patella caerulea]|uniref:Uncharacterized protein n=1 Tax=Patella caerulea TaxID=87958 RepID=A0AAN8K425_PATCE